MNRLILLFALLPFGLMAQTSTGNQHFANGAYDQAIEAYNAGLSEQPGDSAAYFGLARVNLIKGNARQTAAYLDSALKAGYSENEVHYYASRNALGQNDQVLAMEHLTKGADGGMRHFIPLTQDPVFESLRNTPEWESLVKQVELNTYPCLSNPVYRQLDFWLGEWDVYLNGVKVGENSITRANGGCAIHESYTTFPRDYTGQSINFYDPLEKQWHQHWVGSGGDVTNYIQSDQSEGMLQFTGPSLNANGDKIMYRMTFTLLESGDVNQRIEGRAIDDETWTSGFDGIYKRKSSN